MPPKIYVIHENSEWVIPLRACVYGVESAVLRNGFLIRACSIFPRRAARVFYNA